MQKFLSDSIESKSPRLVSFRKKIVCYISFLKMYGTTLNVLLVDLIWSTPEVLIIINSRSKAISHIMFH